MNRAARRRVERDKKYIPFGWVEHPSPKQLNYGTGWVRQLERTYRKGNDFVVMTRTVDTEWGEVTHATISTPNGRDITWAEKQSIKNEIFGNETQAIEIFPKESELVDEADMYHIWILPESMKLPLSLREEV